MVKLLEVEGSGVSREVRSDKCFCYACGSKSDLSFHSIESGRGSVVDGRSLKIVCASCHRGIHRLANDYGYTIKSATRRWLSRF